MLHPLRATNAGPLALANPALVLVFAALCTTPLAAQQLSPGTLLPGDDTPAASAGNQRRPAIAAGGNGLSLAVWEDDRTSLVDTVFGGQAVGSNVPGNFDIYGVLLDANGLPLTSEPIVVNGDTWDQLTPKVAWNGSEYLVVFSSVKPTQFYYSRGIYGVRVSATGAVLDTAPIRIDDDDGSDEQFPTVSSLGGSWLCAWTDVGTSSNTIVNSAFVAANGTVSALRTLVAGTVSIVPTEPRLTAANGRHLLAWSLGFGSGIRAALFDALGNAQGGVLTLAASSGRRPAVASDGTDFYVAWQGGGLLLGTPVSSAGVVAVPGGTSLVPGHALGDSHVAVGHDGSEWLAASNISPDLVAAKVAANGTVASAPIVVTNSPRSLTDVAVGNGNGAVRVLWTDRRTTANSFGGDHDDVFGALVTGTTPSASAAVSTSRPAQVGAKFAGEPATGILCVWKSLVGGTTRFVAAAVDAEGVPVGQPFVVHQGDRSLDGVDVAWDGHEFLVTWHELRSTTSNGVPPMVYCRRCRIDGTLLDPAPLPAMEGTYAAVAAVDRTFLIVARYHHVVLQSNAQMRCRRLDGLNGGFWEATPTVIVTGAAGLVDVVGMVDRWFVAWGNITAAFVLNTGIPQTPFYAANTGASGTAFRMSTNEDRTEAVLAHHYNALSGVYQTDLRIRRFGLTGASPDAMAGPLVTTARQAQLRPAVAALDGEYLVAWADHRDVLDYEPGLGDVFAARLDPTGALLDPNGRPVHDTPVAEGGVDLIRSGRGRALHVASVLHEGTHRLRLGTYANAAAAPWTPVGFGIAGTNGVPTLQGYGTLLPGAGFDLQLASARPNALALLVLGTSAQHTPLLGGTLVPAPAATSLATVLFDGSAGFANVWPAGFSGVHLYAQYWLLDAQAPQGAAASPGLRGIAP